MSPVRLEIRFQIFDPLRRRQDEHHRNDGHGTKTCKGERHILNFCVRLKASLSLNKIQLNLFKSTTGLNIFP
jgi:hypothetical protein